MGIPFYFRTITRRHPELVRRDRVPCGRLFLDLNCAIHQCANAVLSAAGSPVPNAQAIEAKIAHATTSYIDTIVAHARPVELVYVAVDGVPPRAKMAQQRKRRFVASWRTARLAASPHGRNVPSWDSNAITPGTAFMNRLAETLRAFVDDKNKGSGPRFVLSDSNDPGEGEAKIFRYIHDVNVMHDDDPMRAADVIYGLDADLIMLSLLNARRRIFLLREPTEYDGHGQKSQKCPPIPFMYFDTRTLGEHIGDTAVVRDYVAMCFLLGNDFLPPLSYLKINDNGIDVLRAYYDVVRDAMGGGDDARLVSVNDGHASVNYAFLRGMLEVMRDAEDRAFAEADVAYYAHKPRLAHDPTPLHRMMREIDNFPALHKFPAHKVAPSRPGWRLNYYFHLFNAMTAIGDVDRVCRNYLEGMEWTLSYYFRGAHAEPPSYNWYYRYDYSPTALDLYNFATFLEQNDADVATQLRSSIRHDSEALDLDRLPADVATQAQLLMVLPPSGARLMDASVRCLVTDVQHGLTHLYPRTFGMTTYLKKYLWECSPILPLVDGEAVVKKMREVYAMH